MESVVIYGSAKFTDDTTLFRVIKIIRHCKGFQRDLCTLREWVSVWQIPLNMNKYKVKHIGTKSSNY